jgi:hypothetical protein
MGRAWAPAVASIFMSEWYNKLLNSLSNKPTICRRNTDNAFCLFAEREHAAFADSIIDTINPNIRAGDRCIATDVHFLDLRPRTIANTEQVVFFGASGYIGRSPRYRCCKSADTGSHLVVPQRHRSVVPVTSLFGPHSIPKAERSIQSAGSYF